MKLYSTRFYHSSRSLQASCRCFVRALTIKEELWTVTSNSTTCLTPKRLLHCEWSSKQ
jgi:hypothetical protein